MPGRLAYRLGSLALALALIAGPAGAQAPIADALDALHLPDAWTTSTGEGVLIATSDDAVAAAAQAAAPDAEVVSRPAEDADVLAVTTVDALPSGVDTVVVVPADLDLPDDVLAIRVGTGDTPADPSTVTAPVDDVATAVGLVAGTAALLVAEGLAPAEVADLIVGTAQNPDGDPALGAGVVDAATAVAQARGIDPLVEQPDGDGLSPATIGAFALGAALLTFGTLVLVARPRRPR